MGGSWGAGVGDHTVNVIHLWVLLEGFTSFSGLPNLAQMPILPKYKKQGTVHLNDTYFSIQPFSLRWKAINKKNPASLLPVLS